MDPEVDPQAVIASARGDVDERLLTGTDGGFLSRDVLADDPLVAYLRDGEVLHYLLAGAAAPTRIEGDRTRPVETNGGYRTLLAVTDRRVLVVAGSDDGDRAFSLPYDRVHGVEHASGLLTDTVVVMETPDRGLEVPVGTGSDPAAAVSYASGRVANADGTPDRASTAQRRERPGDGPRDVDSVDGPAENATREEPVAGESPDHSTAGDPLGGPTSEASPGDPAAGERRAGRAGGRDRARADADRPVTDPGGRPDLDVGFAAGGDTGSGPDPIGDSSVDEAAPADATREDADAEDSGDGGSSLLGFLGLGSSGDDSSTEKSAETDEPAPDAPTETGESPADAPAGADEPAADAGRNGRASGRPGDSREQSTTTGVDRIPDARGGRSDVREGRRGPGDVQEERSGPGDVRDVGPGSGSSDDVREAGPRPADHAAGEAPSDGAAGQAGGSGRRITVVPNPGAGDAAPVAGEFVDAMFDVLVAGTDLGVRTYGGLDALVDDVGARHRRMRDRLDAGDLRSARTVAAAVDGLSGELERLADERDRSKLRRRAAATRAAVRRRLVAAACDVDPEALEGGPAPALLAVLQRVDPYDFEQMVADLWAELGYQTTVTRSNQDQGIDVVARRVTPVEQTVLIQAKRYGPDTKVGREEVQQYASLHRQEPDADLVVVVTTGAFTAPAREAAGELNVKLVDGERLVDLLADDDLFDVVAGYVAGI